MITLYGTKYNGVSKRPTFEKLIHDLGPKVKYPYRTPTISGERPCLTHVDRIVLIELEQAINARP